MYAIYSEKIKIDEKGSFLQEDKTIIKVYEFLIKKAYELNNVISKYTKK